MVVPTSSFGRVEWCPEDNNNHEIEATYTFNCILADMFLAINMLSMDYSPIGQAIEFIIGKSMHVLFPTVDSCKIVAQVELSIACSGRYIPLHTPHIVEALLGTAEWCQVCKL